MLNFSVASLPASLQCPWLADRLYGAKPVAWRGRGDLPQVPWSRSTRGTWLVLDLWSGMRGLCLALLQCGFHFFAIAAGSRRASGAKKESEDELPPPPPPPGRPGRRMREVKDDEGPSSPPGLGSSKNKMPGDDPAEVPGAEPAPAITFAWGSWICAKCNGVNVPNTRVCEHAYGIGPL